MCEIYHSCSSTEAILSPSTIHYPQQQYNGGHMRRMTNSTSTLKNSTPSDISVSKYHQRQQQQQQQQYNQKSLYQKECMDTSVTICELASPRCSSRESHQSTSNAPEGRCPSNESHCSGNDSNSIPNQTPHSPPVGLPLSATLAPAAAAALLPPQSAAMAAYLNAAAAAAAAQQNHLLLTNPLAAAASLVQHATQVSSVHSPNSRQTTSTPSSSEPTDGTALDFSTKKIRRQSAEDNESEGGGDEEGKNDNERDSNNDDEIDDEANSPLDLSLTARRKRQTNEEESPIMPTHKMVRSSDYKSMPASSTWVPPINSYLAAVAAASMSPKTSLNGMDWNHKPKISPNEATKALEKMTEMTRIAAASNGVDLHARHSISSSSSSANNNSSSSHASAPNISTSTASSAATTNGRHSAWQSHWLNKGADAVKDVFKCVWCKQSFATLASLTTHMKETQHCGVNVASGNNSNSSSNSCINSGSVGSGSGGHNGNHQHSQSSRTSRHSTVAQGSTLNSNTSGNNNSGSNHNSLPLTSGNKSDLNMLIKETMPLPRKLVRGQDVWLGKGAEQTRQILKCMWCGQSFRSLAEMTSHMQETQHYTNIISQEQIISWKSSDDKNSRDNSLSKTVHSGSSPNASIAAVSNSVSSSSTVCAVLTCKVCEQAFPTLKELSNHIIKNNHYKEHMMRAGGQAANEPMPTMIRTSGRGRQAKEKRKKSLPVRKLLEIERAQQDFKTSSSLDQALKPLRDFAASTKITCEKCNEKIETAVFVDHIRQCIGGSIMIPSRISYGSNNNHQRHAIKSSYRHGHGMENLTSPRTPTGRKMSDVHVQSPIIASHSDILCPLPVDNEKHSESSSVLNALEHLIEKSFDTRPRMGNSYGMDNNSANATPLGSSILKRLGIDDTMDYSKPLMDPQTMQFLRSYSNYPSTRDRSASESSSVSERGSSRLEGFTPEVKNDFSSRQTTPRLTPEKFTPQESLDFVRIKSEPMEPNEVISKTEKIPHPGEVSQKISVKKEFNTMDGTVATDEVNKCGAGDMNSSISTRNLSPGMSERSATPKSTSSLSDRKPNFPPPPPTPTESSSLNALSSMFNNLTNMNSTLSVTSAIDSSITNTINHCLSGNKKSNANPLAALQKLCETTDAPAANTRSSVTSNHSQLLSSASAGQQPMSSAVSNSSGSSTSGSSGMLAFSWACNDAVVTADAVIKCSFCDTPFSSKGAYRHHLSKVHFVKDDGAGVSGCNEDGVKRKSLISPSGAANANSPKSMASPKSAASSTGRSPVVQRLDTTPPSSLNSTPTINPYDESPQAKFLKYAEMAKQLSSKNT